MTYFRYGSFVCQLSLMFFSVSLSAPTEVHLGGLFPLFQLSGEVLASGQERLASFLMAVRDINADASLLPNTTVKVSVRDTKLSVGKTFFSSLDLATKSFGGKGIDACIGAATSGESEAAAAVFSHFSTVQISYSSTSPLLSTKINSPYFARTCPSDAFQGAAIADIVSKYYGWTKVSTFANSDNYGTSGIKHFQTRAATMGVQILSSSLFPVGQTDFAGPISDALKSGSRIFIFYMSVADMRNLLLQGTAAGLFGEGRQIVASDAAVFGSWVNIPRSQVSSIMKGIIAFSPSPDCRTKDGMKFIDSFIHLRNTVKDPVTGLCNNKTDDDGNYLFRGGASSDPSQMNCSGLNFSRFYSDGSNIDNYASYTYDATYAIARAMHVVLYDQKAPSITGKNLYRALINNVSFLGATGPVSFSKALSTDITRFGEGDRRTGITYSILNFSPRAYEADPTGITGFVKVGQWTDEEGNIITAPVTYNTVDNSIPTELPPDIILTMTPLHMKILQFSALFVLSLSAMFLIVLMTHRHYRLVKSVQFRMQCIILVGFICGGTRVLVGTNPVTDTNCATTMWLSHLAFWMTFAPMMLKTWRVHRIVNDKSLRYLIVTECFILRVFGVIMVFVLTSLTASQLSNITRPVKVTLKTQVGVQRYLDDRCSRGSYSLEIGLFLLEGIVLIATTALCYLTKDVPGALNEARNNLRGAFTFDFIVLLYVAPAVRPISCAALALALVLFDMPPHLLSKPKPLSLEQANLVRATYLDYYFLLLLAIAFVVCAIAITFPLIYGTSKLEAGVTRFIGSMLIFVCVLSTSLFLFLRRTVLLLFNYDIDRDQQIIKFVAVQPDHIQTLTSHVEAPSEKRYGGSAQNPFETVKSKNLITRRIVCKEQMTHWSKVLRHTEAMMLMTYEEANMIRPTIAPIYPTVVPVAIKESC